jgi:hypothetical protein
MTEVQVFEGEGIDWHETFPEGPHMACVQVATDPVPITEVTKVWVQHAFENGGCVKFLDTHPGSDIATFLNTMFSKANNKATKNDSRFDMTVGLWYCKGCQVVETRRDKNTDFIVVTATSISRNP